MKCGLMTISLFCNYNNTNKMWLNQTTWLQFFSSVKCEPTSASQGVRMKHNKSQII